MRSLRFDSGINKSERRWLPLFLDWYSGSTTALREAGSTRKTLHKTRGDEAAGRPKMTRKADKIRRRGMKQSSCASSPTLFLYILLLITACHELRDFSLEPVGFL